jgi:hypothetical protein
MSSQGNGEPDAYKVSISRHVLELTKVEQAKAIQAGRGAQFRAAVRDIVARLRKDPHVFGEPLYHFHALKLIVRQAVVLPVAITYAVQDERMVVFVMRFQFI